MADPITLTGLLLGAAAACGTAVVEEVTKDAYAALKAKMTEVFGARAGRAIAKIEVDATCDEGKRELEASIGNELSPEDADAIGPLVAHLIEVMRQDPAARQVAHLRIGLDLDVGGDALLRNIEGAREIAIKAVTKGDFTLENVRMAADKPLGK
jgi:hypothetical protein